MTAVTTEREIRSPQNGRVPRIDSPAVSARARARIPITERADKIRASAGLGLRRWWAWTARPLSLRAAWASSTVAARRLPGDSPPLRVLWVLSNGTDRLVMFALVLIAPTGLQGPLRWLACRPTRRWGFYLVLAVLAVIYTIGRS